MTTTTKYLLANEVYCGVLQFGDWRNDNAHPAIVDRDTWQAAQEILDAQGRKRSRSRNPISETYTYYLRGVVKCPHCGCPYTNGAAKGGLVHYYQCLDDTKLKKKCPVGRINADALHRVVLQEIDRAAKHHTVMHKMIAQSGGWETADEAKKAHRGQLAKKKQFNAVQIQNITKAIAEGRAMGSLLDTLEKLEKEKASITQELERVELEIAQATVVRPTAAMIQELWNDVIELWDDATEGERIDILGAVVQEVVVTQKNRVSLKLLPIPGVHGLKFATKYEMGAGTCFVAIHDTLATWLVRWYILPKTGRRFVLRKKCE